MAGLFDLLNTVIGNITQNSVTYATAPTPPSGDSSTKVATTAYVQDAVPSIPTGNVAVWSRDFTTGRTNTTIKILYAPSGGTWFCWGNVAYGSTMSKGTWTSNGQVVSGGGEIYRFNGSDGLSPSITSNAGMCIKIA